MRHNLMLEDQRRPLMIGIFKRFSALVKPNYKPMSLSLGPQMRKSSQKGLRSSPTKSPAGLTLGLAMKNFARVRGSRPPLDLPVNQW